MRLRPVGSCLVLIGWMFSAVAAVDAEPSLEEVFKGDLLIGVAVSPGDLHRDGGKPGHRIDHHFNTSRPATV